MTEQDYLYKIENNLKRSAYDGDQATQTLLAIKRNSTPIFEAISRLTKTLEWGRDKGNDFGKAEILLAALIGEVGKCYLEKERSRATEECRNLAEVLRKNLP